MNTVFTSFLTICVTDKPNCITPTQTIPANFGSVVTMICDVDANPANVSFFWRSKDTDLRQISEQSRVRSDTNAQLLIKDKALKSRLEIRIENGDDFGQYSCWAKNFAGVQEEPCYYNVYGESLVVVVVITNTIWGSHTIKLDTQMTNTRHVDILVGPEILNSVQLL